MNIYIFIYIMYISNRTLFILLKYSLMIMVVIKNGNNGINAYTRIIVDRLFEPAVLRNFRLFKVIFLFL